MRDWFPFRSPKEAQGDFGMTEQNNWQRRMAIQIAAQLPEKTEDALLVLEMTRELIETFLGGAQRPRPVELLTFPTASASSR